MSKNSIKPALNPVGIQELQHLITVSSGFLDAYIIQCHDKPAMLLPQNIVLSAQDSATHVSTVEWHEHKIPVFNLTGPDDRAGVALVIEGEQYAQRFAFMCKQMPASIRIRISELIDDEQKIVDQSIMQYVRMAETLYHVPNLDYIHNQIILSG